MRKADVRRALVVLAVSLASAGCAGANLPPEAAEAKFDPQACAEDALRRGPDPALVNDAAASFSTACGMRDLASCSMLGVAHELGLGVAKSATRARSLYRHACEGGNARACGNLGELLLDDARAGGDAGHALFLLGAACDAGSARHCGVLGWAYGAGVVVPRSPVAAASYLERSCARGEPLGCMTLVDLIEGGVVVADPSHARDLAARACMHGSAAGCARLGNPSRPSRLLVADAPRFFASPP